MNDIKTKKLIYHLTSLKNIRNILIEGLKPRVDIKKFHDIADKEIIEGRKKINQIAMFRFIGFHAIPLMAECKKIFLMKNLYSLRLKESWLKKKTGKLS